MTETSITVSEALGEAMYFARGAWRAVWAAMLLVAAGWALIVIGDHAAITDGEASLCRNAGFTLLLGHLPLLGGLYRVALGGAARRGLGLGGIQLGGVEGRLFGVNIILAFFFALAWAPMALLAGLLYMALRRFDGVSLGPLGHWEWWFLAAAAFAVALLVWLTYLGARVSMASPLTVERRKITPWRGWPLTEGSGWIIASAFALAHIPTLIVFFGLQAFGWIEPIDVPVGLHGPWPLPEAAGAGVVAGLGLSAIQAPLSVGLITFVYDVLAPVEAADHPALTPEAILADAATEGLAEDVAPEPEAVPEPDPEPEPDPPFSVVEFFPHTGRFSRISSPWLADEPLPDLYAGLAIPYDPREHEAVVAEPETYPHSIVEYSPHSGRFSRLFSPWLSSEEPPHETTAASNDPDRDLSAGDVQAVTEHHALQPEPEIAPEEPNLHQPASRTLDLADEPEHAER